MADWRDFTKQAQDLLDSLDDLPERAAGFAESVREKVESMMGWVEENEHVTSKQWTALENMREGVEKWQR